MKIYDIAFKDVKSTLLSVFSLVMMFGAPLLITGLLYFAFGGLTTGGAEFNLPATKVVVANLDQASAQNAQFAAGDLLLQFLQDDALADVLTVTTAASEAEARAAVDGQAAGVAIILPTDFTLAVTTPGRTAAVTLYQDPTLTIGPGIVKDLVKHFLDAFSGAKIAGLTAANQLSQHGLPADPSVALRASQQYAAWLQAGGHDEASGTPRLAVVSPTGQAPASAQAVVPIGSIMAGMAIFFVFFIGANGAQSIIHEDEEGTLARLLTTPTSLGSILSGKFIGIVVALVVQVLVLLGASALLFHIHWGQALSVLLVSTGLIAASAGFGLLVMAFIKNSRQTGPVLGGVMTLTGMLGGLFTTGIPNVPKALDTFSLVTPQGWAMQAWKLALAGAGPAQVLVPVLVLIGMGVLFLAAAVVLFRRRFA
jgi:ABC-2 type transport system permease protein